MQRCGCLRSWQSIFAAIPFVLFYQAGYPHQEEEAFQAAAGHADAPRLQTSSQDIREELEVMDLLLGVTHLSAEHQVQGVSSAVLPSQDVAVAARKRWKRRAEGRSFAGAAKAGAAVCGWMDFAAAGSIIPCARCVYAC